MTQYATPSQVAEQAQSWTDQQVNCRVYGHAWRQAGNAVFVKKWNYYAVSQVCLRECGTQRHQELNDRGMVLDSWYVYPDGYLSDLGRVVGEARGTLRIAALLRGAVSTGVQPPRPTTQRLLREVDPKIQATRDRVGKKRRAR